jgi:hypothetical protein
MGSNGKTGLIGPTAKKNVVFTGPGDAEYNPVIFIIKLTRAPVKAAGVVLLQEKSLVPR